MHRSAIASVILLVTAVCYGQSQAPLLLQHPTLSTDKIVFVYGNDLWSVSRDGGAAERLTAGVGAKSMPAFSPDGTQIAFSANFDGNIDVYVMPATGGVPRRLTYHPAADQVRGWTRDGKSILFTSSRDSYSGRFTRLFTVPTEGGFPTELPLPIAQDGSFSPSGEEIAYVPLNHAFEIWKHYRGGGASPVWIARLSDSSTTTIPREGSNDFNPMWIGQQIFFLSDRNGPMSLFAYDTNSQTVSEALKPNGFDFKYASAGPGAIVVEQFGAIWLYDLNSGKAHKVDIRISGDLPERRPRFVNVASRIQNADISPTGQRAVFEARGEILTVPAEKGDIRNLTNTAGAHERDPVWSPDGTRIAYFSDESGEYELYVKNQDGQGDAEKIVLDQPPSFYFDPAWSPDSKKIAYSDKRLNLWYVDVEKKTPVHVARDLQMPGGDWIHATWSPDSKWLAYAQPEISYTQSVFVYSLETQQSHRVTDGMSESFSPIFDKGGKYLYLLASTDSGPLLDGSMHSFERPVTTNVYVVVLRKDLPSPLAPESDEESAKPEAVKADNAKSGEDTKSKESAPPPDVKIDFEKITQRILSLPIPARNYTEIQAGKEGTIFVVEAPGAGSFNGPETQTAYRFDLKTRKTDKVVDDILAFRVSANGEKMLYRTEGGGSQGGGTAPSAQNWAIAPVPPPPPSGPASAGPGPASNSGAKTLNLSSMEVRVDPVAEWRQMYHEAFRLERDFFYEPNFHGWDLAAAEKQYEAYLPGLGSRSDLNYLFAEAMGNLTVGHLFVNGGDMPEIKRIPVGLLGADYKIENGRYRFAHVYDGENWNPQVRAPLTQPGINVAEGEYLLAVNGREVRGTDEVYSFFEETAGKSTLLRVGPNPDGSGSREVSVVPVESETTLRNLAWIEGNRREVDELSHDKLAYIYLPDTSGPGYEAFNRYFFPQGGKEGAVIDERFNGGGSNTDYILDYLRRTLMNYRSVRDADDMTTPVSLIQGPKAMIINEYAGSGGDAMPWHFRQAKIGVLVGKRTWGGLVGFYGPQESLMDGGVVTTPSRGFWTPNNQWEVENHGVDPDVEVELDPKAVREGHDPQLERSVELLLRELKEHPIPAHKKPPYPIYRNGVNVASGATRIPQQ